MSTTLPRPTLARGPHGWRVTVPGDAIEAVDFGSFADARKVLRILSSGGSLDDAMFDLGYWADEPGCECEIDWRCHHHAGQPTWLETRYDDLDDEGF